MNLLKSRIWNVSEDLDQSVQLLCVGSRGGLPNITLQQLRTQMILSRGALYVFILRSSAKRSVPIHHGVAVESTHPAVQESRIVCHCLQPELSRDVPPLSIHRY